MGEVTGAGLLAHVPTIMLPYSERLELNEGKEISLVPGLERLRREVFEAADYDTVVVLDSHWHTTVEFIVAAQDVRAGLYTSDELPRGMCRIPYDWRGDPGLADALADAADAHGTWITAIDDPYLPVHYATVNLWTYLGRGLDKQWISVSTAQTGETEDFLRVGRALRSALEVSDHARVIAEMPEFLKFRPEARFGPYLMMIGALGESAVTAPGRLFSEYENSVGTGQLHVWFDRPAEGWVS